MELFLDALLDALIDGVKMLPFLYLAYLLIEWLERHHGESIEEALAGGSSYVRPCGLHATSVLHEAL